MLARSAKVTIEIIEGSEILERGHEVARHMWNFLWWCGIGFNRKMCWGDPLEEWDSAKLECKYKHGGERKWLGMKWPKWPSRFKIEKAFRDYWAATELSDRCYSTVIKEFVAAMKSWFSNLKTNRRARPPRYCREPRQLTFEVGRNAKPLGDWTYRLTVLGGKIPDRHAVVKIRIRPGIKMRDIKLIRLQPDGSGTVTYYQQPRPKPGDGVAAVDLGINNLAVVVFDIGEFILYSGRGLLASDQWYQKRAAKCKPSGWKGKGHAESRQSRRNIVYRVKAGNIRWLAIHNFTRSVINECVKRKVGILIVGDLKHIRTNKDFGKAVNVKLHAWPFAEILRQLQYKGEEVGIKIVTVSERHTSQTCHVCGAIDKSSRTYRGLYDCKHCGAMINADLNGALNILKKYLLAERLGVEAVLPGLPSLPAGTEGTGEALQIPPTFVARFDLRNWAIVMQDGCNRYRGHETGVYKR